MGAYCKKNRLLKLNTMYTVCQNTNIDSRINVIIRLRFPADPSKHSITQIRKNFNGSSKIA